MARSWEKASLSRRAAQHRAAQATPPSRTPPSNFGFGAKMIVRSNAARVGVPGTVHGDGSAAPLYSLPSFITFSYGGMGLEAGVWSRRKKSCETTRQPLNPSLTAFRVPALPECLVVRRGSVGCKPPGTDHITGLVAHSPDVCPNVTAQAGYL
eukprot:scaffold422_cov399-Prasinococcus_capsulatus_cf.AAC.2